MCVSKYYHSQNEYICNVVRRIHSIKEPSRHEQFQILLWVSTKCIIFFLLRDLIKRTWACAGPSSHQTSQWSVRGKLDTNGDWMNTCQACHRINGPANVNMEIDTMSPESQRWWIIRTGIQEGCKGNFLPFREDFHWNTKRGESGAVC